MRVKKLALYLLIMSLSTSLISCSPKDQGAKDQAKQEESNNQATSKPDQGPKLDKYIIKATELEKGKKVGNEILTKDVNVVSIWLESCPPCRDKAKYLERLSKKRKDVNIVGLGVAESEKSLKQAVKAWGLSYKNYLISDDFLSQYKDTITSTPTLLYLDKQGQELRPIEVGFRNDGKSEEQILKEMEAILDELTKPKK